MQHVQVHTLEIKSDFQFLSQSAVPMDNFISVWQAVKPPLIWNETFFFNVDVSERINTGVSVGKQDYCATVDVTQIHNAKNNK